MPPQLATVLCSDACKSIHCKTAERPENPGGLNSNVVVVICPPGKIWGEHPLPLGSDGPVLHCSMMLMLDEFPRKAKLIQILGKYFPCIATVIVESIVSLICCCFDTEGSYVT